MFGRLSKIMLAFMAAGLVIFVPTVKADQEQAPSDNTANARDREIDIGAMLIGDAPAIIKQAFRTVNLDACNQINAMSLHIWIMSAQAYMDSGKPEPRQFQLWDGKAHLDAVPDPKDPSKFPRIGIRILDPEIKAELKRLLADKDQKPLDEKGVPNLLNPGVYYLRRMYFLANKNYNEGKGPIDATPITDADRHPKLPHTPRPQPLATPQQ